MNARIKKFVMLLTLMLILLGAIYAIKRYRPQPKVAPAPKINVDVTKADTTAAVDTTDIALEIAVPSE